MNPAVHGGFPKGKTRKQLKARKGRIQAAQTKDVRVYVFAREREICRCCRIRKAESMHELRFRSLGGKVSRKNSIAVCGDGVRGCHGFLQRLEIDADYNELGAEGRILFRPSTFPAMEWLKLHAHAVIESMPMVEYHA